MRSDAMIRGLCDGGKRWMADPAVRDGKSRTGTAASGTEGHISIAINITGPKTSGIDERNFGWHSVEGKRGLITTAC